MGYIDPAAFGVISQVGYLILFALVTGFMFLFNSIKRGLSRLFHRTALDTTSPRSDPPQA